MENSHLMAKVSRIPLSVQVNDTSFINRFATRNNIHVLFLFQMVAPSDCQGGYIACK